MSFDVPTKATVGFAGRGARTVSADELARIRALHLAFLARAPGGRRAILKFTNLSGLNISGWCLVEADHSGALLHLSNLTQTDLRDTNLFGAALSSSDLAGACLESADLRGATIRDFDSLRHVARRFARGHADGVRG